MHDLTNNVALITGGSRGIGEAIAIRLANAGCDIALVARSEASLRDVAKKVEAAGRRAVIIPCDMSVQTELAGVVSTCVAELGRLDILVNNAGLGGGGKAQEADLSELDKMMNVNVISLMHLTRHALPHILEQKRGAVINIASVAGKSGFGGSSAYCASKHAVVGFSNSVYEDVRQAGVKVCAICPGFVNTPMVNKMENIDPERMIQCSDIADVAHFVATAPDTMCPTEIIIRPQRTPYR